MSVLALAGLSLALAAQSPAQVASLRELAAREGNDRAIAAAARDQPDSLREALSRTFARAATANAGGERDAELRLARRLADGYARAWADSFHLVQVASFARWSPRERLARVAADSLRRAGIEALGQEGVPVALSRWREALARVAAPDSAGRAAMLLAVGGGLYRAGQLDSAATYLTRSRDLARVTRDHRTLGNAVGILASISKDRGELARAAALYQEATAIRERSGDRRGIAADQNNLGTIARTLGDLDQARRAFARALELNRSDGRTRLAALNLLNLAGVASVTGDYDGAGRLYREALALNRADGDVAETGFVLHGLGLLASRRGDYVQSRDLLSEALAVHEKSGASLEAVEVKRDLAALQATMGDLQGALTTLREVDLRAAAAAGSPGRKAGLVLTTADLAVQLGSYAEAEAGFARAEQLYRSVGDEMGLAEARHGRGLILHLRGDHPSALHVLGLAARTHGELGDPRSAALTRLLVGHIQGEIGDTAAARRTLTAARATLESVGDAVGEAAALDALGQLSARGGAPLAAEQLFRRGLQVLSDRPGVDVRWQLHAHLAEALRSRGDLRSAAPHLEAAVAALENVAGGLRLEERRVGYLADKWRVYASLALVEQGLGRLADAFAASERLRARQLRDMLARGRVTARHEVSRREQDLRFRITELMKTIEASGPRARGRREAPLAERSVDVARAALARTQREYASLLLELRESDPGFAAVVTGETVSWRAVAARLGPQEVFLEYLLTDSTSTVFVVTPDTIDVVELGVSRGALTGLVEFARRTMDRPGSSPATPLWRAPLRRLYQHLIEPIAQRGYLDSRTRLVIAAHGDLHFLPFGALLDGGVPDRFLIERFELAFVPSATVWVRLAERTINRPRGPLLALAPHTATLPGSREEVLGIGRTRTREATVLMGSDATEQAFREAAPRHAILHLATYGILNKHNPLFSFVALAATPSDDGRLEVHEVYGLDLRGQLVVLSACQTALGSGAIGDVPAGDDWVGLVQAFLHAGAGSVLASLWPVEDRATAQLMQHFYRQLAAGRSEAAALAAAQRIMLRDRATLHPFHWAGFVLVGGASAD